jgi:hypothetical protein
LNEGFEYLKSGDKHLDDGTVFFALASILSAYPSDAYNRDVSSYVQSVEESHTQGGNLQIISNTYSELAIIGSDYTLKLLKERATYGFWESRDMASVTGSFSDMTNDPFTVNAMSVAINALGRHPLPEAEAFLLKLQNEERYMDDVVLSKAESFDYALNARQDLSYYQNRIKEALALKESIFGSQEMTSENTQQIAVEIPEAAPAVVEAAEELPTVKQEVKESSKVKPVEVTEEALEQSSQWWLWLVGALVILGGVVVMVRRKS